MDKKKVLETEDIPKEETKKKVTYDDLMHAKTVTEAEKKKDNYSKITIIKYIAVSIILFAIIIGSFILFRQM